MLGRMYFIHSMRKNGRAFGRANALPQRWGTSRREGN
jgi:hypothetical protein